MRKVFKLLISVLLTLCMCFSLTVTNTFAENESTTRSEETTEMKEETGKSEEESETQESSKQSSQEVQMKAGSSNIDSGTCGDNLTWALDDEGTLTISGSGNMTDYSSSSDVPWNSSRSSIKVVTINEGVANIGHYAFYDCDSLTSIAIPDSLTSIGNNAFEDCTALTNIALPNSVTNIGFYAFYDCINLTSITIPSSVISIKNGLFCACKSLTSITIPDSVTSIGNYAFNNCINLTSITIPEGVMSIGNYAFSRCESLTSITIPDGVTSIGNYAFSRCESLTSITIPDSVTSIGSSALSECTSLTNFTIPNNLTSIGNRTFQNCESLKSITIPNGVTSIGKWAFADCSSLTSITIPDSVESIGEYAFQLCVKLKNITIPDSVTSIGPSAFSECSSLTSIVIPASVTSIGNGAFNYCSSLTSITVDSDNSEYTSVNGVLFNKNQSELLCCPGGKTGSYVIPDSVTNIGSRAFSCCENLTSITIPNSVTGIGQYAFYNCISLPGITIPDSVTSIGSYTFYNCIGLTSIEIPDSVTSIKDWTFIGCANLASITIPKSVTSIGRGAFCECESLKDVYYLGSENKWNSVEIGANNSFLANATIHYGESDIPVTDLTLNETSATLEEGETITLTATVTPSDATDQTIIWTSSDDNVATVEDGVVTAKKAGSATITVAASNGISATCEVTVEEAGPTAPVITKQPEDITVNAGETTAVTVEAEGDELTYQWQKSNDSGETWSNCTSAEAKMASFAFKATAYMNGRQFRCIVTNSVGTVTSEPAVLTVAGVPVITEQPESTSAAIGETVNMKVTAEGSNLSYQWERSTDQGKTWVKCTSAGSTTATFTFTMAKNFNGRMFRCKVSSSGGSVTSSEATVTLDGDVPVITKQPEDITVNAGETTAVTVEAEGGDLTYQWQKSNDNGKTWSNCTSAEAKMASFAFKATANMNGRQFRCNVTNSIGTVTSEPAVLTVAGVPVITKQPESTSAAIGEKVSMKVTAEGSNLSYQWERSTDQGKTWVKCTSTGSTTATFSFTMAENFNGRMFRCKVSSSGGTVTSSEATVTLKGEAPVITEQPESTSAAEGETVSLKVTAEGNGLSYQWERSTDGGKTWVKCTSAGSTTSKFEFEMLKKFDGRMFRCRVSSSGRTVTSNEVTVSLN